MTPDDLKRLEELHGKATPGEWIESDNEGFSAWKIWQGMTPSGHGIPGKVIVEVIGDSAEADANAELIAALHNAFPELIELARDGLRYRWAHKRGFAWRGCYGAHWAEGEWLYESQGSDLLDEAMKEAGK